VKGALYMDDINDDRWHVIDVSDSSSKPMELEIKTESGDISPFKIVNLSDHEEELCNKLVDACKHLEKGRGNARSGTGDKGVMFGIGRRNGGGNNHFHELFAISDPDAKGYNREFTEKYCIATWSFSRMMKRYFPKQLSSYKEYEEKKGIFPSWQMGGLHGLTCSGDVSVNLCNAEHLDVNDADIGVSIWVEEEKNNHKNWYILLPSTYASSDEKKRPIAIKVFHGIFMAWDGRKVRHCTSYTTLLGKNNVYGCFFCVTNR